jgi:uncharacterized membrane protein
MTTKAFTIIAVRILGLMALFRGAAACVSLLTMSLRQNSFPGASGTASWNMAIQSIAVGSVLPIVAGIVCLAYSKPIAAFLAKGTEENSEHPAPADGVPR